MDNCSELSQELKALLEGDEIVEVLIRGWSRITTTTRRGLALEATLVATNQRVAMFREFRDGFVSSFVNYEDVLDVSVNSSDSGTQVVIYTDKDKFCVEIEAPYSPAFKFVALTKTRMNRNLA